jgi:hypothetical protein
VGGRVVVAVRPEQLELHTSAGGNHIAVRHRLAMPIGPQTIHEVELAGGQAVKVIEARSGSPRILGAEAWLALRSGAIPSVFPVS